jgi:hypothetical protein
MMFHGAYVPQRSINRAGSPAHPDLYARDVPVALRTLGMSIQFARRGVDIPQFIAWIRREIRIGRPVLVGMKIHPTRHDNWILDHFTLASGYTRDALVINTTYGKQQTLSHARLSSMKKGLSFKNRFNRYYGISIHGPAGCGEDAPRVRIFARKETRGRIHAIVSCENLVKGKDYVLVRSASRRGKGISLARFVADGPYAVQDVISKKAPAVYRCSKMFPSDMLGSLEPKHFRREAWRLLDGEPLLPSFKRLERAAAGSDDEKSREALAMIRGLKAWVISERERIRTLAKRAPAAALAEARRFAVRVRGLHGGGHLHAIVKSLESDRSVEDLSRVLDDLHALRTDRARGLAEKDTRRRRSLLVDRVQAISSRPSLPPATRAEADGILKRMKSPAGRL